MAFVRLKSRRGRRYAYLVESVWEPGASSPRQRVIKYLGAEERARLEDVPEEYRNEPAVRRWFEARSAAGEESVPEAEVARMRRELREVLRDPTRGALDKLSTAGVRRMGTWEYLRDVAAPVLQQVGDDWHEGRIDTAQEHVATRAVQDLMRRLRDEEAMRAGRRRQPTRLVVVLATPEGESHSVALDLIECRLAQRGHRTIVLAGGTPPRDLAQRVRQLDADLVLLSATMPESREAARRAADAVLERSTRAQVWIGGQAWDDPAVVTATAKELPQNVHVLPGPPERRFETLLREAEAARENNGVTA